MSDSLNKFEASIVKVLEHKSEIFFGESSKEIEETIFPVVITRIISLFFPEHKKAFLERFKNVDLKNKYDFIERVSKVRSTKLKEDKNVFDTTLTLAKDVQAFLMKLLEIIVSVELKLYDTTIIYQLCEDMLYIYSPIAHSFGFYKIRSYIENLSFSYMMPDEKQKIEDLIKENIPNIGELLEKEKIYVHRYLNQKYNHIKVKCRVKSPYSIYRKMLAKNYNNVTYLTDLLALRVITENVSQCYEILGHLHNLYVPISDRIKDYIVKPKINGYQSLHTTVKLSSGYPLEIQIRTEEMDNQAEFGPSSHTMYKSEKLISPSQMNYLQNILKYAKEQPPLEEWNKILGVNEDDTITVFTPKGDLVELPKGSNALDFAYAIKPEIGNQCLTAKVDGKSIALDAPLDHGQVVEIVIGRNEKPNIFWLEHVTTKKAKEEIKRFLRQQSKEQDIEEGRKIINKKLSEIGKNPLDENLSILKKWRGSTLSFEDRENLLMQVSTNTVSPNKLMHELFNIQTKDDNKRRSKINININKNVIIDQKRGIVHQYAQCCNPQPGDKIVGYSSFKGYISVHKSDCRNIEFLPQNHIIDVKWDM